MLTNVMILLCVATLATFLCDITLQLSLELCSQTDLKLQEILLPRSPECWAYTHGLSQLAVPATHILSVLLNIFLNLSPMTLIFVLCNWQSKPPNEQTNPRAGL